MGSVWRAHFDARFANWSQARIESARKAWAVTAALLLALLAYGAAAARPVLSCATPGLINTGVSDTGALLAPVALDPNWMFTPVGSNNVDTLEPKAPSDWSSAYINHPVGASWTWTTYPNANWISVSAVQQAYYRTYFRKTFDLDPAAPPGEFSLSVNFHADDNVLAVFVNGVKQDAHIGGGGWGGSAGARYTLPG